MESKKHEAWHSLVPLDIKTLHSLKIRSTIVLCPPVESTEFKSNGIKIIIDNQSKQPYRTYLMESILVQRWSEIILTY